MGLRVVVNERAREFAWELDHKGQAVLASSFFPFWWEMEQLIFLLKEYILSKVGFLLSNPSYTSAHRARV